MDHQTVIGREQHDEEDVCKLATAACLESNECRGGQETHEPSSPSTWMSASTFAEQLGIFAKSLTGCPEPIQRGTANAQPLTILEEVVRDRSSEVARRAEYSVATSGSIESDSEEQLNDESVQQPLFTNAQVTEVFDPTFRFCFEVPTKSLVHLPPARLNITRLVFCRNYAPGEIRSCTMGEACKFVHADVDFRTLEAHPIHVKYSWRREDLCTYARLPAGEVIRVSAPNNRPPVEEIPSDRVLVTRGSLRRHESHSPMSHCAHYFFNRMCNRGERCNFIHVVHVDPNVVGDFKRAPARCVVAVPRGDRTVQNTPRVDRDSIQPAKFSRLLQGHMAGMKLSFDQEPHHLPAHGELPDVTTLSKSQSHSTLNDSLKLESSGSIQEVGIQRFRHNPYSLRDVITIA